MFVLFCFLLKSYLSCEDTCYSAYKDGSLELQEVKDGSPTIAPINSTGVVTIEAAYIPGVSAQWEYIRFLKNEEEEPLVMQFYTPGDGYDTTLKIFGEDEIGIYPNSRNSVTGLFNSTSDNIVIQVSDVHVTEDKFYRIYLGEPGSAHSIRYNYESQENWEALSFMRLNTTTKIKTDNQVIYFKSVSVCSDETPALCGNSAETVAVTRDEAFNLSCSVYGAPYLEAVWSNEAAGNLSELVVYSVDGFLQTTTVFIDTFNDSHMGEWTCYWRNKNFGTMSSTKVFHVVELVSKPSQTTYVKSEIQLFKWVVKYKRSEQSGEECNTLLDCKEESSPSSDRISVQYSYEYSSAVMFSECVTTMIIPKNITADNVTCTLYHAIKSGENFTILGVLDTGTFYKGGYHCKAGYYGVGEECVECAANLTSLPQSVTCTVPKGTDVVDSPTGSWTLLVLSIAVVVMVVGIIVTVWIKRRR